jgi:predicted MFS family arabinose efflux permease
MNPWRGLGDLPKESWILFATALVNRAGTMVMPFLVLYLTDVLALSPSQAGLAVAAYGVGAMVSGPPAGHLSDRIGGLRVMRLSLVGSGIILIVLLLVRSFEGVLIISVLWAVISEAFRPANLSVLTSIVKPEQRKAAVALNRLAVNLGMSIGPAAAGFLAHVSFKWLFILDCATSLMAAAVLTFSRWRVRIRTKTVTALQGSLAVGIGQPVSNRRQLFYFLLALLPTLLVFFQTQASMPLYVVRYINLDERDFGLLLTVNTVLIIFIEVPLNSAIAGWSHRRSLPLGTLLSGGGFALLMLTGGFWTAALTVAVWTLGEIILFPASAAYVADIAPEERRGVYMGLYHSTFSVAFALGPWLGVQVLESFGARALSASCLLCGWLSGFLMLRLRTTSSG